ncbi:MAG: hypothetical protein ACFFB0_18995 [Promethearchaeota archaeon]
MFQIIERAHSFDIREQNKYDIQKKLENFLQQKFMLSTSTTKLGRSLLRINYFNENLEKELQKDNRITILHEPEKRLYIQVKGNLTDMQVEQLWNELEKDLIIIKKQEVLEERILTKDEIINRILNLIKSEGYTIENSDVHNFIDNFQQKYNRLPKEEELNSIVKGYILMKNEDYLLEKAEDNNDDIKSEFVELTHEESREKISLSSGYNGILIVNSPIGRRKCPSCENEGLIREVDDKSVILLDYPRIYGKKYYCGACGQEWREQ